MKPAGRGQHDAICVGILEHGCQTEMPLGARLGDRNGQRHRVNVADVGEFAPQFMRLDRFEMIVRNATATDKREFDLAIGDGRAVDVHWNVWLCGGSQRIAARHGADLRGALLLHRDNAMRSKITQQSRLVYRRLRSRILSRRAELGSL